MSQRDNMSVDSNKKSLPTPAEWHRKLNYPYIHKKNSPMANTYSQLYVQYIFAVKNRNALIPKNRKEELHKYITGLISNKGQKLLAIHAMPDHIHIFIGFKPDMRISDLVKEIKTSSNSFINENKFSPFKFKWQEGYGAFTYAKSQISAVCNYIENQEAHHSKISFKEEYLNFLKKFEINHKEKYLFDFID